MRADACGLWVCAGLVAAIASGLVSRASAQESFEFDGQAGVPLWSLDLNWNPALGRELEWDVSYTSTEVILSVGGGCVADWNQDGVVNTLDFLAYLNLWTTGDSAADINADGNVNTLDFLEFLNLWTAWC